MKDLFAKFNGFGGDTAVVLLFLAVEVGRSEGFGTIETLLMGVTMLMLLVLPFFLLSGEGNEPSMAKWLFFRGAIMVFGLGCGIVLPGSLRFLPMNFLILAGICSCFARFYGLTKLRLAD